MIAVFSVPVSDEHGHGNLNYHVLSSALENYSEVLDKQAKEQPDNEYLIEEQRTCLLLLIDVVLAHADILLKDER